MSSDTPHPPRVTVRASGADEKVVGRARAFAVIRASRKNPAPMSAPAPRRARPSHPVRPPSRIERAFVRERARRRARIEHERERRRARARFVVLLVALLFLAVVIALSIWDQIEALFGL
jgi:hypothetical protein